MTPKRIGRDLLGVAETLRLHLYHRMFIRIIIMPVQITMEKKILETKSVACGTVSTHLSRRLGEVRRSADAELIRDNGVISENRRALSVEKSLENAHTFRQTLASFR